MRLGDRISLAAFQGGLAARTLEVPSEVYERLKRARAVVDDALSRAEPVYGLNTGLGANLGHRIAPSDIPDFQRQLIEGRAVAVGPLLPAETGRAMMAARLIGVAQGHSGMSVAVFDHLCALWRAGLDAGVPQYGAIGASDLTQNATWALGCLGQGQIWDGVAWQDAKGALMASDLSPPALQPKDAMALINHSALSVALAGAALSKAQQSLAMAQHAAVLSFQGFAANPDIFAPDLNALRSAPGQSEMAAWFASHIGPVARPNRVQDALSFRTLAPVMGAAQDALTRSIAVWEDELNGASDSPVVLGDAPLRSTPNFHAPALALALEQVSLAMAMVAWGIAMRMQRLMDPDLTGLPRYLAAEGGASAGFVPLQKTAAALLADIRRYAVPVAFDAAPVSDGVEDMAPMTPQAAQKLTDQMRPFHLLVGGEAIVAAQACDLRELPPTSLHEGIRAWVPRLSKDRPIGQDVEKAARVLRSHLLQTGRAGPDC